MRHQSSDVHAARRHEVDGARKVVAHAPHELDLEVPPARLRGPKRVNVAVRNARKNNPASNSRRAHRVSESEGPIGRLDHERAPALARCVDEVFRRRRDILCAQFERGRAAMSEGLDHMHLTRASGLQHLQDQQADRACAEQRDWLDQTGLGEIDRVDRDAKRLIYLGGNGFLLGDGGR